MSSSCACAPGLRSGRRGGWIGTRPGGRGHSGLSETLAQGDCSKPPGTQRQRLLGILLHSGQLRTFRVCRVCRWGTNPFLEPLQAEFEGRDREVWEHRVTALGVAPL